MGDLVAIIGSVTPPGRLNAAVRAGLKRSTDSAQVFDLADLQIAGADGRSPETLGDDTADVVAAIDAAAAVLLATPVYRGSMTGTLKNLLDQVPVEPLRAKPVGLVSMGASHHHFLGADRHLRDILSFFGAWVLPTSVYLTQADFADGKPQESAVDAIDALVEVLTVVAAAVPRKTLARLIPIGAIASRPPAKS